MTKTIATPVKTIFKISFGELLRCVNIVKWAMKKNSVLPILDYIRIDVLKNGVSYLYVTDLESSATVRINDFSFIEGSQKNGFSFLIDTVTLKGRDNDEILTFDLVSCFGKKATHEISVLSSDNSKVSYLSCASDDFPMKPKLDEAINIITLYEDGVSELLKAMPFVGKDELRPIQHSVSLLFEKSEHGGGNLVIASTDAHRLFAATRGLKRMPDFVGGVLQFDITPTIVKQIQHWEYVTIRAILPKYEREVKSDEVVIATNIELSGIADGHEVQIIYRVIDGKFPNFRAVIPDNNPFSAKFSASELIKTIDKALPYSNKATNQVRLSFVVGAESTLDAGDIDMGRNFSKPFNVECEDLSDTNELEIAFNGIFLKSLLKEVDDDVTLKLTSSSRAGLIEQTNFEYKEQYLLMPIMLNN